MQSNYDNATNLPLIQVRAPIRVVTPKPLNTLGGVVNFPLPGFVGRRGFKPPQQMAYRDPGESRGGQAPHSLACELDFLSPRNGRDPRVG